MQLQDHRHAHLGSEQTSEPQWDPRPLVSRETLASMLEASTMLHYLAPVDAHITELQAALQLQLAFKFFQASEVLLLA